MKTLDIESLKNNIDLVDLAGRYTSLHKHTASGEMAGPCPKLSCPADEDGFHVHPDGWWKCYTCHPKRSDVIEFVKWMGLASDFIGACKWLDGTVTMTPYASQPKPKAKKISNKWDTSTWQKEAKTEVETSIARLESPEGAQARVYLTGRGIDAATWRAWRIGYATPYRPIKQERRPAISIPWTGNGQIKAIQYRFIDDDLRKGQRFSQRKGGEKTLFGIDLIGNDRHTLIACEGELNAISTWQAIRNADLNHIDVVSIGAEGNAANPYLNTLAQRYKTVIVWTDKEECTTTATKHIPHAYNLKSPTHEGEELDANDMLRLGILERFITLTIARLTDKQSVIQTSSVVAENKPKLDGGAGQEIELLLPPGSALPTIHGKWERKDNGYIRAAYTLRELSFAMMTVPPPYAIDNG